jgi:hypothetical protein
MLRSTRDDNQYCRWREDRKLYRSSTIAETLRP